MLCLEHSFSSAFAAFAIGRNIHEDSSPLPTFHTGPVRAVTLQDLDLLFVQSSLKLAPLGLKLPLHSFNRAPRNRYRLHRSAHLRIHPPANHFHLSRRLRLQLLL